MPDRIRFYAPSLAFFAMILVGGVGGLNAVGAQPAPPPSLSIEDFVAVPDDDTYTEAEEPFDLAVRQANMRRKGDGTRYARPAPVAFFQRPVGQRTRSLVETARLPMGEPSSQSASSSDGVPRWAYIAGGATLVAGGVLAAVLLTGDRSGGSDGATLPPGRPE